MTKDRIQTFRFGKSDIIKLIKALDVSKAHGHDGTSVKNFVLYSSSTNIIFFKTHLLQVVLLMTEKELTLLQFIKTI